MAKAFIFSVDAFVAFTLILIVLHSLIFISAIPSSYYGGLMQANYLARDTLNALAVADAGKIVDSRFSGKSVLEYVISDCKPVSTCVDTRIGALIPVQYGYALDKLDTNTKTWVALYDTNKNYNKFRATGYTIVFDDYIKRTTENEIETPYSYITCNPAANDPPNHCGNVTSRYGKGSAQLSLVRLTVYR